ncbi:hypothetical protein [Meridianimarinicoccus marinus]
MARAEIDPLHLDLLEIASTVFFADGAVPRGGPTRPEMGSSWRRSFSFTIPVRNPTFWNRPDVGAALVNTVGFLTEDSVSFAFTEKATDVERQPFLDLDPTGAAFDAEEVILFSGGLDSFAGALEALSTTSAKVILLTHRSAQKAIPRQVELGKHLADRFPNRMLHINVLARRRGQEASDSSQRSRSFLFAALGQVVAGVFGARRVSFYENGVISHNLPISPQVVGAMATRTTHPLALRELDRLMQTLGETYAPIENRYKWMTKRDVVERIAQNGGADSISRTVSCTSIREQTTLHTHCGTCSQCLDRRFAILAAGLEAHDFAEDYGTDVLFGARETTQSRTMAVEWTRHAMHLTTLDARGFVGRFGLEFSRIAEGHPEQRKSDTLDQCLGMHARHGHCVKGVLERMLVEKSDDILHERFPESSLIALFLGKQSSDSLTLPVDPRESAPRADIVPKVEQVDLRPDPQAPLMIEFLEEGGAPVVSVVGMCRLTGRAATVPHVLKAEYFADKCAGLERCNHRHVQSGDLAQRLGTTKDVIRQSVKRCRTMLRSSFLELHDIDPERELLLQHRAACGYRLDPEILVRRDSES